MMTPNPDDFDADAAATYKPAFIAPLKRDKKTNGVWDAGLFDASGAPIPHAHLNLHKLTSQATPDVFKQSTVAAKDIPGEWLFAGVLPRKTGHIILNALGRLWMTDHLPQSVGLLFVPHLYDPPEHPFLSQLLTTLGLDRRCRLVTVPARVECLHVGPDGFSSALQGQAAPEVVQWIRRRANPNAGKIGSRKLYITRGRLSPLVGRHVCEDILEENLAQAGYEIIVPESMSLRDQFDLYSEATEVIAAEGTALHIAALALPDAARLVVIQRRHDVPDLIRNHLDCFLANPVVYLDAIDVMHWPEERAVNVALTTLDFARLRIGLIEKDLISPSDAWRIPTDTEILESRAKGRGQDARFLTLEDREKFLKAFRRRRRQKRRMK
ncbi:MAG: DUF563 domain-containing protein [Rhodobacteraceae bacterium]|nr:DUF563 domain-containing protein [Paracoccaceae bacterium]